MFAAAIAADPANAALVIGEAEALLALTDQDPTQRLRSVVRSNPTWAEGHSMLASLRWEMGEREHYADELRRALATHRGDAGLWNAFLQTLAGVEDFRAAAEAAEHARQLFNAPMLALIEANNRGMLGEDDRVEQLLQLAPVGPDRDQVEVRHRLRLQQWDKAAVIVDRKIEAPAADLSAWALAEVLWRQVGDSRSDWLAGDPRLILRSTLPYSRAELDQLAAMLGQLHRQQRQPVGQSVRGGTQTRGRLLDRRDPEIQRLRDKLQSAVDAYRGQLPPFEERHPLLRHRDRTLRVDGGWSVRLTEAGFHVPHLHPAGVLSSAFYVRVPALDAETREGWLELGRPPADQRMDLEPRAMMEPQAGTLILFPSFLYHGTRPFGSGERLSVAFDVT